MIDTTIKATTKTELKHNKDSTISNKIHPNGVGVVETSNHMEGGELAPSNKVRSDMIEAKPNYRKSLRIIYLDNEPKNDS